MTVFDCEGFGKERTIDRQDYKPYVPRKRIKIFAPDELVGCILSAVMTAANTHQHETGKVYIIDVGKGGHIRTGKQEKALA